IDGTPSHSDSFVQSSGCTNFGHGVQSSIDAETGYAPPPMLKPGDEFERYTIEAPLGEGGMGHVYRALDGRLGRRVAVKVISEGLAAGDARARLLREARAAAALDHPNAVAVFDVGEADGTPYIVMELVDGRTLREASRDATLSKRIEWLADAG